MSAKLKAKNNKIRTLLVLIKFIVCVALPYIKEFLCLLAVSNALETLFR